VLILFAQLDGEAAYGQLPSPNAVFAGADAVNPQVVLSWDRDIDGFIEDTVKSRLQTHFELGLRRQGIRISKEAQNSLSLYLIAVGYDDQLIVYSWRLAFEELAIPSRSAETSLVLEFPAFEAAADTAASMSRGGSRVCERLARRTVSLKATRATSACRANPDGGERTTRTRLRAYMAERLVTTTRD
jgi:hypothetical protein